MYQYSPFPPHLFQGFLDRALGKVHPFTGILDEIRLES
jgi:hypothetical protein